MSMIVHFSWGVEASKKSDDMITNDSFFLACKTKMSARPILVKGRIGPPVEGRVEYTAAAPPDSRTSFSGSGLPFANPEQAFGNTPNRGFFEVGPSQTFEIHMLEVNSFYENFDDLIGPSIYIRYTSHGSVVTEHVKLGEPIAHRLLTYPAERTSALFYLVPEQPVRTQEQILYDGEYSWKPGHTFWEKRPPI